MTRDEVAQVKAIAREIAKEEIAKALSECLLAAPFSPKVEPVALKEVEHHAKASKQGAQHK